MNGNKADAQIRVEQDVDLVLKNFKLIFLGEPQDETLIATDPQFKHNKANEGRSIPKKAYCSGKGSEKRVISSTTKFSFQSN